VAGVRGAQADVGGTSTWLAGIDPRTLSEVLALPMADGTTEDLRSGRIFVSDTTGLRPGDEVRVGFARTGERRFTVAGVYRSTSVIGDYLLTTADVDRNVTAPTDLTVLVTVAPGRTVAEAERAVDAALQNFPLVRADTVAEFANARRGTVDQAVNTVTALLALSLLIALLGVANTLSLSVIERTREIGLLRAVGMLRRQLRRTIRLEAAVIAAYGALLGAALGVTLGIAVSTVLLDRAAPALPVAGITTVVVGAALTAVVAAALPARRAARLPLLDAIHTT
jgi:putative ABC transport system permease protein